MNSEAKLISEHCDIFLFSNFLIFKEKIQKMKFYLFIYFFFVQIVSTIFFFYHTLYQIVSDCAKFRR